jgi:processive 1,2-diacylglycerol beta-glucosyltransferase
VSSGEVAAELERRGVPRDHIAVTGIPIRDAFRQPTDPAQIRLRYHLDPDLPIILIMSGAFGALGGVGEACRALTHMRRPVQLVVVCGRDRALARRLQYTTQNYPYPVHVFGWVEAVADLMVAARTIVTKAGGVTTAEALALGVPMVIFRPIPGQEEANTRYLARHGAARIAQNTAELEAHCDELLIREDLWADMRRAALTLGRPEAAHHVAELSLRLGGLAPAPFGSAGMPR